MRPPSELIDDVDPAWPEVTSWLREATNEVRLLATSRERGEKVLHALQVTTRSPLGALALESGGLAVDGGWLRVSGGGGPEMDGDLASWNALGSLPALAPAVDGALRVALDAPGGVFAINAGGLGDDRGMAYYFAPDALRWQPLERGYSDLLRFFLFGDLDTFYGALRWPGWRADVAGAGLDVGFSLWPPPWSKEGKNGASVSRRRMPLGELVALHEEFRRQLDGG